MKANLSIKDLLNKEFLHDKEVHALDVLLAGEIAAVDAYNLAMERVKDVMIIPTLEECRNSHAIRIQFLRDQVEKLGEVPPETAGWWGAVARIVEGGATVLSDRAAMSVLAAGEDFGYDQYVQHMKDLDSDSYKLVEKELLPAQGKTLQTMTLLCAWMRSEELHTDEQKDLQSRNEKITSQLPAQLPEITELATVDNGPDQVIAAAESISGRSATQSPAYLPPVNFDGLDKSSQKQQTQQ